MTRPVMNLDEVEFDDIEDNGYYTSRRGQISDHIGARLLGYNLTVLLPGKAQCPFHNHHGEEEMFFILDGEGDLRFGEQRYPIRKNDVIACPTGGREVAHQIINTGTTTMRYLAVSNVVDIETCEYPDSDKVMIAAGRRGERGLRKMFRAENTVDYYDRESNEGPLGVPPPPAAAGPTGSSAAGLLAATASATTESGTASPRRGDPAPVTLREITADTVRAVTRLAVTDDQQGFVAPNAVSLAQALFAPEAWYRAIYRGDELAGFVMLADESQLDPPPTSPAVSVWRLMVDAHFQGRGVGRAAMLQVIEHVRSKGCFKALELSYVPGPGCPEPFYRALGFAPTGRVDEGEIVLELPLDAA